MSKLSKLKRSPVIQNFDKNENDISKNEDNEKEDILTNVSFFINRIPSPPQLKKSNLFQSETIDDIITYEINYEENTNDDEDLMFQF